MDKDKKLEWTALEYEEKDRGKDWFWALGIIIAASSAAAFIYGNYFFGLFLILSGALTWLFALKKPDLVFYEMNEKGLMIRNRLYPYEDIKAFWIETEKHEPTLFIKTDRGFMPIIPVPMREDLAGEAREAMLKHKVPEEEMKMHFSEKIMEYLGF